MLPEHEAHLEEVDDYSDVPLPGCEFDEEDDYGDWGYDDDDEYCEVCGMDLDVCDCVEEEDE